MVPGSGIVIDVRRGVVGETRHERIEVGVRLDLRGINVEFVTPHETRVLTQIGNLVSMSWRSVRIPSKNMTSCSLKKTTGSMLGRLSAADSSCADSRTTLRSSVASRCR